MSGARRAGTWDVYGLRGGVARLKTVALATIGLVTLGAAVVALEKHWFGAILLVALWCILVVSPDLRQNRSTFHAAMIVGLAVTGAAIWNSFVEPLPGGGADGARFLREAGWHAEHGVWPEYRSGSSVFVIILTALFLVFGVSSLTAHALTAVGTVVLLVMVARLRARCCGVGEMRGGLLYLVALLPSAFLFRAAPLREAWEAAFLTGATVAACGILWRASVSRVIGFVICGVGAAMLHAALGVGVLFQCAAIVAKWILDRRLGVAYRIVVGFVAGGLLAATGVLVGALTLRDGRVEAAAEAAMTGDLGSAGILEQEALGGASYGSAPGMNSGLVLRVVAGWIYYWLAPLPWQVRSGGDLLVMVENFVRVLLLLSAIAAWRRSNGVERGMIAIALGTVVVVELAWSVGTSNWGTAIRHHIPAYGILCALGYPIRRRMTAGLRARAGVEGCRRGK